MVRPGRTGGTLSLCGARSVPCNRRGASRFKTRFQARGHARPWLPSRYAAYRTVPDPSKAGAGVSPAGRGTRATPSRARRRKSRPAATARSPGRSADTASLSCTTCVSITWSVRVKRNSTAPTSRVPPADSRCQTSSVVASVGTPATSTSWSTGFDVSSRRSAVSRVPIGRRRPSPHRVFRELAIRLLMKHPAADVSSRLRIEQPDRSRCVGADRAQAGGPSWLRRQQFRLDHAARCRLGTFQLTGDSCQTGEHDDET